MTNAPIVKSLCPPIYFVKEFRTISAPLVKGSYK